MEDQAREKEMSADERARWRQAEAKPRLEELKKWLQSLRRENGGHVLPKSPMGEAIGYTLNQWDALNVYLTDGRLSMDNNVAENALRRVALGRKNWLFVGSDNGGRTAAVLYSLISSCKRHKVEPWAYLRDVLTRIPQTPAEKLGDLLPDRWQALMEQTKAAA
ncbi:MAG: IS66 family transposase [Phycisphaerae bacterium]